MAPGPTANEGSARSATPRLLASSLPFARPSHAHCAASDAPLVCQRDASIRCWLSGRDEITRPYFSRDDNALHRRGLIRSTARVRSGTFKPRHLVPQPKAPIVSLRAGIDGVLDALLSAQHVLEMFRRALPNEVSRRCLDRLANRLSKIIIEAHKLSTP